jgi:hypothetical protein
VNVFELYHLDRPTLLQPFVHSRSQGMDAFDIEQSRFLKSQVRTEERRRGPGQMTCLEARIPAHIGAPLPHPSSPCTSPGARSAKPRPRRLFHLSRAARRRPLPSEYVPCFPHMKFELCLFGPEDTRQSGRSSIATVTVYFVLTWPRLDAWLRTKPYVSMRGKKPNTREGRPHPSVLCVD